MPAIADNIRRKRFLSESYHRYGSRSYIGLRKQSPYTPSSAQKNVTGCRTFTQHPPKAVRAEPHAHIKTWTIFEFNATAVTPTEVVFHHLVEQWQEDTLYDSSLEAIWFHPAYQTIMAMGEKALPLILKELEKQSGHWSYALSHIVRQDVGKGAATLEDARRRWLEWGRASGLI